MRGRFGTGSIVAAAALVLSVAAVALVLSLAPAASARPDLRHSTVGAVVRITITGTLEYTGNNSYNVVNGGCGSGTSQDWDPYQVQSNDNLIWVTTYSGVVLSQRDSVGQERHYSGTTDLHQDTFKNDGSDYYDSTGTGACRDMQQSATWNCSGNFKTSGAYGVFRYGGGTNWRGALLPLLDLYQSPGSCVDTAGQQQSLGLAYWTQSLSQTPFDSPGEVMIKSISAAQWKALTQGPGKYDYHETYSSNAPGPLWTAGQVVATNCSAPDDPGVTFGDQCSQSYGASFQVNVRRTKLLTAP